MGNKIKSVLIVGGGIGGMSCAIAMQRIGIDVEIVDIDPNWRALGAGITVTGPTLRAFSRLGVMDEILSHGAQWGSGAVHDASGKLLEEIVFPSVEPGVPGNGGVMRPVLHNILSTQVKLAGIKVRLGLTVADLIETDVGAEVVLTDGNHGTYDLVVAADGAFSKLRERLFPNAVRPKFTGQGIYRIVAERPPEVNRSYFYMGADMKIGFNPVSPTQMYMFLLEFAPENPWLNEEEQPKRLHKLMAGFGGIVPLVRDTVLTCSSVNYRPLEASIQPAPWHCGHVVLLGDAAHATTPHLASGAGMAVEDALVLTEEIQRGGKCEDILVRFTQRRYERCKLIVENSIKLGELEMMGSDPRVHAKLMSETIQTLRQPI